MKNNDGPRTIEVTLQELKILNECPQCKDILIETIESHFIYKTCTKCKTSWEWEW